MYINDVTDEMIDECKSSHVLLTPGECSYEVISAEEHTARSSGNKMPKIVILVEDMKGRKAKVFDYLVSYKLIKFLLTNNLNEALEQRQLVIGQLIGLRGYCCIKHENDLQGQKQNKVHYYIAEKDRKPTAMTLVDIPAHNNSTQQNKSIETADFDDDIPF